jgi:hypothetical protein
MKTYLINYKVYLKDGTTHSKKIKVKNSFTELHAKSKLEDYCKKKINDFDKLVVNSCSEEIFKGLDVFNDIFKGFKL